MPGEFDQIIGRGDADALIPVELASQVLAAATQASAALSLCRQLPMSTKQLRTPVLSMLPESFWVSGDTGLKGVTKATWTGVDLVAEEIATIVPVPESVIADSAFPIFEQLTEPIGQSIAARLDAAVFSGIEAPASWPEGIIPGASRRVTP